MSEKYKQAYLNVEMNKAGMFSSERLLGIKCYEGHNVHGFFDKSNMKEGKLRVSVLEESLGEKKDATMIIVPQYLFETNRIIHVKNDQLSYEN